MPTSKAVTERHKIEVPELNGSAPRLAERTRDGGFVLQENRGDFEVGLEFMRELHDLQGPSTQRALTSSKVSSAVSPCRCRWIAAFPSALRWTDIHYGVARLIDLVPPEDHGGEEQPNRGGQSSCSQPDSSAPRRKWTQSEI